MVAITHDETKLTLSPKLISGIKRVYQLLRSERVKLNQSVKIYRPKQMHYTNREWNRNSAFIMSQFELAQHVEAKGRGNE
jgi:hypothetical protein